MACALVLLLATTIFYVSAFVNAAWFIPPIRLGADDALKATEYSQTRFLVMTAMLTVNVSHTAFSLMRRRSDEEYRYLSVTPSSGGVYW